MLPPVALFPPERTPGPCVRLRALCAVAVLLIGDRMALLLVLCYPFCLALTLRGMRKPLLIALPVIAALFGALLYLSPVTYHRQVESTAEVISHIKRISAYGIVFESAFEMARDYPVFGVGMHNYQAVCVQDRYGPLTSRAPKSISRCLGHPHNIYLLWLAETGILGLALYLAFVVLSLKALVQSAARNAGQSDLFWPGGFAGVAVLAFIGGNQLFFQLGGRADVSHPRLEPGVLRGPAEPTKRFRTGAGVVGAGRPC